jgi:hypothetical protein
MRSDLPGEVPGGDRGEPLVTGSNGTLMARTGCGVVWPAARGDDLVVTTANGTITRHASGQNVHVEDDS